jgi:hypothetical protein
MIYVQDDQWATVWEVEDKGNYSEVKFSTSRKDKKSGEYINSSWAFTRFVGDAHKKASDLNRGDKIKLKGAGISREPYMKDGEKLWPKNPSIVVFNFEFAGDKAAKNSKSSDEEEPSAEQFPF